MPFTVAELWRFPVKSLQGERLERAEITTRGIVGDRAFGVLDEATGLVLTARREPQLLYASARTDAEGAVTVTLPDGREAKDDAALTAWLGRSVRLLRATPDISGHYEIAIDFEHEATSEWVQWTGPRGTFHDSTRTRVSLVSRAAMRDWDTRRFRINVVLAGDGDDTEDDLVGATVRIGDVELDISKQIDRCVIVTRPQPGGIPRDLDVLRTIHRERGGNLGIGALVRAPGTIAVGDVLTRA